MHETFSCITLPHFVIVVSEQMANSVQRNPHKMLPGTQKELITQKNLLIG